MMQAMVEEDEDERPDDGKVEIPSEGEYRWLGVEQFHPPDPSLTITNSLQKFSVIFVSLPLNYLPLTTP